MWYICDLFCCGETTSAPDFYLPEICQNTCPENYIVLCFSHCSASACFVYFHNRFHGIVERKRNWVDSKSHCLSMCILTSHLEFFIQSPEKKKTAWKIILENSQVLTALLVATTFLCYSLQQSPSKNCPHFCLHSLPFCCESVWIRLSSTIIPSYYWAIREPLSQYTEYLFWLVILVIIQTCCVFKYNLNSVAKCMTKSEYLFHTLSQINLRWINYLHKSFIRRKYN